MESDHDIEKLTSFLAKLSKYKNCASRTNCNSNVVQELFDTKTSINKSQKEQELQYLEKCIRHNENCCVLLNKIESSLFLLLEDCMKEQRLVNSNVDKLKRERGNKKYSNAGIEQYMRSIFRMPYFKDESGFSHSLNEDVSKRRIQGFMNQCDVVVPHPWNEDERKVVVSYIRKTEEEKWKQTLKACGMLKGVNVEDMSLAELIEERYDEYDWLTISVSALKNTHSPHECRLMWLNTLHPQINQQMWTEEENMTLRNLVTQFKGQDWDSIVQALGTKRSAFQCIRHFKILSCKMSKCEWTENEIELLKRYVKIFRFGQFVPWHKIMLFMEGRNSSEIFRAWNKINEQGKPRTFSLEEDIVLVAGMRLYGKEYTRIKDYLPYRSVPQVRKRIEVLKGRQFPRQPWSTEEDKLLKDLVQKYGFGNWQKISMHFVNRNPPSVRGRYAVLQRHMNKYGSSDSCASFMSRNPRRSTDIVNFKLLWETAKNMCEENNCQRSINNVLESNSNVNIVSELSRILKPEMRQCRDIEVGKLKPISARGYYKFFRGAYLQNECKRYKTYRNREIILSSAYYALMALKMLEAKIVLPPVEKVEKDKSISELDKYILSYLINEISVSDIDMCEIDISLTHIKETMPNLNLNNSAVRRHHEFFFLFPPNVSSLIALRSILLNHSTLKEQEEGSTMQVDNIEWKNMYTSCLPKSPNYGKNHDVASKMWNERIYMLLHFVTVMLNKESESYNSALNVLVQ